MVEPYSVALTSCGRFDLLDRTLASLVPRLEGPVAQFLVIEDSGDPAVADVVRRFDGSWGRIETIVNDPPLGQTRSIDRLYEHVTTEWIFHCEDDWEFYSDGFISRSFALLKEFDRVSMVSPRDSSGFLSGYWGSEKVSSSGVSYRLANPEGAGPFSGMMFSPGLRRMRDYRIVGSYNDLSIAPYEPRVGQVHLELGYRVACLGEPAVRHTGDERHVPNSAKSRSFGARMGRSTRRMTWEGR